MASVCKTQKQSIGGNIQAFSGLYSRLELNGLKQHKLSQMKTVNETLEVI